MNQELLQNWIDNGYAVANLGDGAWAWTDKGIKEIPGYIRIILSGILYGQEFWIQHARDSKRTMYQEGFTPDGFVLTD